MNVFDLFGDDFHVVVELVDVVEKGEVLVLGLDEVGDERVDVFIALDFADAPEGLLVLRDRLLVRLFFRPVFLFLLGLLFRRLLRSPFLRKDTREGVETQEV